MENLDTWVKFEQVDENYGIFEMSPLERGMGLTIGNSLRRVILSSLEGMAPISLYIEGIRHEFDTIEGVQEDVLDIIFNIKSVVFGLVEDNEPRKISLEVSGEREVKASDLELPADVKIINPDQHLFSITDKNTKIELNFNIEKNIGYRASEDQDRTNAEISRMFLDSSFSPVDRVNHTVDDTRVGQDLNYDKLKIELWSNGSVSIEDCMKKSASKLMDSLSLFGELNRKPVFEDVNLDEDAETGDNGDGETNKIYEISVEDLELSARSLNCLKKANINTIGELVQKDLTDLYNIKNFGKKSAEEINAKLKEYDLVLSSEEV
ncbi:MAG: DNA-directed RNA polymerase subunit alpha [Candidatus Margulisiibacteriota bacterium]|nr:DNA-directed RNA polymerase subunit alpha [Candidatus Margulisiibacteriota bacterium]